eukprot:TRINITY_DN36572_c0_g1_i1.p1 TRINITY_DN36572_c0_g1~~TRINITY_DN36572_c0_g1_i1.p1  ORF type:complete len:240 (-),score=34.83 TRINITY_DN36572_c0_g1_i1:59-778(-)
MFILRPLVVYVACVLPGVDAAAKKIFSNEFVETREIGCCEAKENFKDMDTSGFQSMNASGAYLGPRTSKSDCQSDCISKDWCSAFMYGNAAKECWLFNNGCAKKCESNFFDFHTRVPNSFISRGTGDCRYDSKETFRCSQPSLSSQNCIAACKKYAVCAAITVGSENGNRTCHRHFTTKVRFDGVSCQDGEKATKVPEDMHGSGSQNNTLCFAVSASSSLLLPFGTKLWLVFVAWLLCK